MPDLEIREAEHEDWDGIARLLADPPPLPGDQLRRQVQSENDPLLAYVAVEGDSVIGAVVAGVPRRSAAAAEGPAGEPRVARLTWIGVTPRRRRQGHGRRLLQALLEELHRRQIRRLALSAEGTEIEALAFFRAHGFEKDGEDLDLVLPAGATARALSPSRLSTARAGASGRLSEEPHTLAERAGATLRPLRLDDIPLLTGLLIHLAVERAVEPHDSLRALTPAEVESWLQRAGTSGVAAWERDDPNTPLGLAWVSRRRVDAVLHFIGVHDEARRRGIGAALLHEAIPAPDIPLRARITDPGDTQLFFRALGFEPERITFRMSRPV
jgi:ribosomal protein S18 acetylase RimI-like enzyme